MKRTRRRRTPRPVAPDGGAAGGRPNSLRWHYPDQVRGSAGVARTLSAVRSPVGCEVVSLTLAPTSGRGPAGHPPTCGVTGRRRLGTLPIMRVDARGLTFEVRVGGPTDGAPVLLLHGFPQHGGEWDDVVPALHAAGLRTYAPDQRGYSPGARPDGGRPLPDAGAASPTRWRCSTRSGVDAAHVVGHDWGAVVAWRLAARHPERVRTLTAVSVPHPAAMAHALRHRRRGRRPARRTCALFRKPGKAEKVLLALATPPRCAGCSAGWATRRGWTAYADPMREPGALTAALNWYRAMSRARPGRPSARSRCRPRTSGATGTSRSAGPPPRRAPTHVDRRLPLRRAARGEPLDPRRGARPARRGDPGPGRRRDRDARRRPGRAAALARRAAPRLGVRPGGDAAGARRAAPAPGFDPAVTPSRFMGALAETVRAWPGALRSYHPHVVVRRARAGRRAGRRPGTPWRTCSARAPRWPASTTSTPTCCCSASTTAVEHLAAPGRVPLARRRPGSGCGAAVRTGDGGREWVWWEDVRPRRGATSPAFGADLEATGAVRAGTGRRRDRPVDAAAGGGRLRGASGWPATERTEEA